MTGSSGLRRMLCDSSVNSVELILYHDYEETHVHTFDVNES
jgi:hypothetical protein